jgi:hypothetical protein
MHVVGGQFLGDKDEIGEGGVVDDFCVRER